MADAIEKKAMKERVKDTLWLMGGSFIIGLILKALNGFPVRFVFSLVIFTVVLDVILEYLERDTPTKRFLLNRLMPLGEGILIFVGMRLLLGQIVGITITDSFVDFNSSVDENILASELALILPSLVLTVGLIKNKMSKTIWAICLVICFAILVQVKQPAFMKSIDKLNGARIAEQTAKNNIGAREKDLTSRMAIYEVNRDFGDFKKGMKVNMLSRSQMDAFKGPFQVCGKLQALTKEQLPADDYVMTGSEPYVPVVIADGNGFFVDEPRYAPFRLFTKVIEPEKAVSRQSAKAGTPTVLFSNTYTEADLDADGKVVILDFTKTHVVPGDVLNISTSTSSSKGIVTVHYNDGVQNVISENGWSKSTFVKGDQLDRGCITITFAKGHDVSVRTNVVTKS